MDQTFFVITSHKCSTVSSSAEFEGHARPQTQTNHFLRRGREHYPAERGHSHQEIQFELSVLHSLQQCLGRWDMP